MSEQKLKIRIVIKPPDDVPAAPTRPEPDHNNRRMAVAIFLGLAAVTVIAVLGWQYLTPRASGVFVASKDESPPVAEVESQAAMDVTRSGEPAMPETPEAPLTRREQDAPAETQASETASVESQAAVDVAASNEPAIRETRGATLAQREQAAPAETQATETASVESQPAVGIAASNEPAIQETLGAALAQREQTAPAKTPATETAPVESQAAVDVAASNEPAIQETPETNLAELEQGRPAETPATTEDTEQRATALSPIAVAADRTQATVGNATETASSTALESELAPHPDMAQVPSGPESAMEMDQKQTQAMQPADSAALLSSPPGAAATPIASVNGTDPADVVVDANPSAPAASGAAENNLSVTPGSAVPGPSSDPVPAPVMTVTSAEAVAAMPDHSIPPTQPSPETMPAPVTRANPDPGLDAGLPARVARSALSSDVRDREPVDELFGTIVLESGGARRLYYFTEVQDMAGETVQHRWVRNGETVATVEFPIGGVRWRIYSSKLLSSTMDGQWEARAESADGEVLDRIEFNAARP